MKNKISSIQNVDYKMPSNFCNTNSILLIYYLEKVQIAVRKGYHRNLRENLEIFNSRGQGLWNLHQTNAGFHTSIDNSKNEPTEDKFTVLLIMLPPYLGLHFIYFHT